MPYWVMVEDNFQSMDDSGRYCDGVFDTVEAAEPRFRAVVDGYLDTAERIEGRDSALKIWESYKMFGDDPFIVARDATRASFSAWSYARRGCQERSGQGIADRRVPEIHDDGALFRALERTTSSVQSSTP